MTRKRYIKLLMSSGVHRNTANHNALTVQRVGWSYQRFYDDLMGVILKE